MKGFDYICPECKMSWYLFKDCYAKNPRGKRKKGKCYCGFPFPKK